MVFQLFPINDYTRKWEDSEKILNLFVALSLYATHAIGLHNGGVRQEEKDGNSAMICEKRGSRLCRDQVLTQALEGLCSKKGSGEVPLHYFINPFFNTCYLHSFSGAIILKSLPGRLLWGPFQFPGLLLQVAEIGNNCNCHLRTESLSIFLRGAAILKESRVSE